MPKKDAATRLTKECQKAFDKIQEYLSAPPVLVPPEPDRPLLLYLYVLDGAFDCVLGQHDKMGRKEHAIYYLREDIIKAYDGWRMFFDGAANFKGVGIGAILVSKTGQHYPVSAKIRFPCTNNMAEYEACIMGLNLAIDMNIQELLVIGDSDLLVHQVLGEWATKNTKILSYLQHVQESMKRFTKKEFKHIPRIQNEFADALATLSSMIQHLDKNFIDPIPVRIYNQPAYCAHVQKETNGNPWFHDIKEYLAKGEYSEHANHTQKCTLQRLSNHFFQSGGILYVQKCQQCQVHADMIRVPPNELNATSAPWPFAAWGMDVIGPIEPSASNEHMFILVAIDYFTKWVEAVSYKAVTKKVFANFVRDRIVC
ncbi:uncharacterized protein [Nicotiana sylvestris]|uniref:uncharacterized protein n=1 Tax=Nicotiana sylvestris TaxID=4096 RepID=UPI00388C3A46